MEIFGIILIILFFAFIGQAIAIVFAGIQAFFKTLFGSGTFSDNFQKAYSGPGAFEIKGQKKPPTDDVPFPIIELSGQGIFPNHSLVNLGFVTSLIDVTDDARPVLGAIDDFQEPHTPAFQHRMHCGVVEPNQGLADWSMIATIIPQLIAPPFSGRRKMIAVCRLVNLDNMPPVHLGLCDEDHAGVLATYTYEFEEDFTEKGYEEEAAHVAEARKYIIKLAIRVAMADGSFADEEGNIIKEWISSSLTTYSDEQRDELKDEYNEAFRDGFIKAKNDDLSLSDLTAKLNEIAGTAQKYEAVDLCFDVMAADGVAEEEELVTISQIAEALELDFDEIQKMKDQRLIKLSTTMESQPGSSEAILGIKPEWSTEAVQKHLRAEFAKWNGRLNTLPEGEERENAQKMLNMIAEARKKYAAQS